MLGSSNLTVEARVVQVELLEFGKHLNIRRDGPAQFVSLKIEDLEV